MTQAFNLSQFANKVNTSGQADLTTAITGTLPVANGGTNQTTYTDGQLLIGNTTGNTLTKATLTAGSGISVTNGSGSITIASTAAGGFTNMQVFTSPGTFTTPSSTTKIKVTVVGGGGAGGASQSGGAGGGGTAIYVGPVTASTPYAVTIGAGGTYTIPTGNGSSGSTSSFGSLASATGGSGVNISNIGGGAGGAGSAGTLQFTGGGGSAGIRQATPSFAPVQSGGAGGSSYFGGGAAAAGYTTGNNGTAYGGGGNGGGNGNGGSGFAGVVIVEY